MPELPEVESVRRGLAGWVAGAHVQRVRVLDERILGTTSRRDIPAGAGILFAADLAEATLTGAQRRGKFMWLPLLDGHRALAVHLGMSGQFRIHQPGDPVHKHTRAIMDLHSPGNGDVELRFIDQRIFGHLGVEPIVPGMANWGASAGRPRPVALSASHIAPDPFEPGFEPQAVARVLARKNTAIKTALLDQSVLSGIGNIYADEALFAAGVHPLALADRLRISRVVRVVEAAREVMARALEVGGTSFDDLYVNVNGESGYFARSLQAYGREGQPCTRCARPLKRIVVGGRSTHFCPTCQRPQR